MGNNKMFKGGMDGNDTLNEKVILHKIALI
jgi:hypothetical protein